jgi:hypothetical protein
MKLSPTHMECSPNTGFMQTVYETGRGPYKSQNHKIIMKDGILMMLLNEVENYYSILIKLYTI